MPRKPRRKNAKRLSERPRVELSAGEAIPADTLECCLKDFDIQVTKMIKQFSASFQTEAKKFLKSVPTKSSLPQKISKMSLKEFKTRGNSVKAVLESLKENPEAPMEVKVASHSNENEPPNQNSPFNMMMTPAQNTRSQRTARKPKPWEELSVSIQSKTTGSPVDEASLFEAHMKNWVDGMDVLMRENSLISGLPACHRRKVIRAIQESKGKMMTSMVDITKTPALVR